MTGEEEEEKIGQNYPTRGKEQELRERNERSWANGEKREKLLANRNREMRNGERVRSGGKEEKWVGKNP
ncbi:hypothetical protein ACFX15_022331 [Malus domestica]